MQITLGRILELSNHPIFGLRLPQASAYKFAKLGKIIGEELKTFDEARQKLLSDYEGSFDPKTGVVVFPTAEKEAECNSEFQALLGQTLDLPSQFPIHANQLGNVEMSANELLALGDLLILEDQ